jgi:hypothetical protein
MTTIWGREPAAILGLLQAVLALVVAFGFDLSAEQVGVIVAVSAAVLTVLTRTQVTPTSKLPDV